MVVTRYRTQSIAELWHVRLSEPPAADRDARNQLLEESLPFRIVRLTTDMIDVAVKGSMALSWAVPLFGSLHDRLGVESLN